LNFLVKIPTDHLACISAMGGSGPLKNILSVD